MVETEQTAKPFPTFDRRARGLGGTSGKEEHVADTLMGAFLMIVGLKFGQSASERLLSKENEMVQTYQALGSLSRRTFSQRAFDANQGWSQA